MTNEQEKRPQTAGTVGSHESAPATASDLGAHRNTDWRAWLDLEPVMGWFTDSGEEVWGVA